MLIRRASVVSPLLALCLGIGGALWLAPRWSEYRALTKIKSKFGEERRSGWEWLLRPERRGGKPRAIGRLDRINTALEDTHRLALRQGAGHLRQLGLWGWEHQPPHLILRESAWLAGLDDADQRLAAEQMLAAPLDLDIEAVLPVFAELLTADDEQVRMLAFRGVCGWLGRERANSLTKLPVFEHKPINRLARHALQLPGPGGAQDSGSSMWADIDRDVAFQRLAHSVAAADDSVYEAVLLVERLLECDEAAELAASWLVDFSDDRKRAGALLAALLGEHAGLLEEALAATAEPHVRTTMRMATFVLGRPVGPEDPVEFAYRALHRPDGDFDPDIALSLLAAGNAEALELLTSRPHGDVKSIRRRALLIERFVPHWHAEFGPPTGDGRVIAEHFDRLHALWLLEHRRVRFDAGSRTFDTEVHRGSNATMCP